MANPDFSNNGAEQASAGAITVNLPPSWAPGQTQLLFVATDGFVPTLSTPSGFSLLTDPQGVQAVATTNGGVPGAAESGIAVFYRVTVGATSATDPAPVIAAPSGGGTVQCCHINTYANCRTGNPCHKVATAVVSTATTTINPPSITTLINGCTVFSVASSSFDDSLFNNFSSAGAATPGGTIDSGWHSPIGNACAWSGGRGGFATAGGPHNCTSIFATATKQAQITFALASLAELPRGAIAATSGGSRAAHAGTVAVTGAIAATLGGSSAGHTATAQTPATGAVAVTLAGSTAAHQGVVGLGGPITGTLGPSAAAHAGVTSVAGAAAGTLAPSAAAHAGTVGPVTGAIAATSGGSRAAHAGTVSGLRLGAVFPVRQKAEGNITGFASAGNLTTLSPITAWTAGEVIAVEQGIRRVSGGNVYELVGPTSNATITTANAPSGTGTATLADGSTWRFVAASPGSIATTSGSMIVAFAALGNYASASAVVSDNAGNTFTQVDRQTYLAFPGSDNAMFVATSITPSANHTLTKTYAAPGALSDEATVSGFEVIGATVLRGLSYVESITPQVSNTVNSGVTTADNAGIVAFTCWLDGGVRNPGDQHRCVPSILQAPAGVTAQVIPLASAPTCLSRNGYIQEFLVLMVPPLPLGFGDPVPPGKYQIQISTDQNEGSAIRGVSAQVSIGEFGPIAGTIGGSTAAHTGTVSSSSTGAIAGQMGGSIPGHAGAVLAAGAITGTPAGSRAAHAGAVLAAGPIAGSLAPSAAAHAGVTSVAGAAAGTLAPSAAAHAGTVGPVTGSIAATSGGSRAAHVGFAGAVAIGGITAGLGGSAAAHAGTVTTPATGAIVGTSGASSAQHAGAVGVVAVGGVVVQLGASLAAHSGTVFGAPVAYSSINDLQVTCGGPDKLLQVADWERAGTLAALSVRTTIDQAIDRADRLIDAYIGRHTGVPLAAPVPGVIRNLSTSLARLVLLRARQMLNDADRDEWEQLAGAQGTLAKMASGEVTFGVEPMPRAHSTMATETAVQELPPERSFARNNLKGFF